MLLMERVFNVSKLSISPFWFCLRRFLSDCPIDLSLFLSFSSCLFVSQMSRILLVTHGFYFWWKFISLHFSRILLSYWFRDIICISCVSSSSFFFLNLRFFCLDQIDENLKKALQEDLTQMAPGLKIQVSYIRIAIR